MAVFVLVHGGWRGGWCYARVARRLRDAGHDVFTPTLTGLGERSHLARFPIDLSTHITDVANLIQWEDLSDVVLCGHSYGGMVVTGVAGRMGDRIRSLFYLDALVPDAGQSLIDLIPSIYSEQMIADAEANGGYSSVFPAEFFGGNPADIALIDSKSTPHPWGCYTEKLEDGGRAGSVSRRTYVYATKFPGSVYRPFYERFNGAEGWTTHVAECGHDVMLDAPDLLARLLLAEA